MWRKLIAVSGVCAILIATPVSASAKVSADTTALKQALDQVVAAGMPGAIAADRTHSVASGVADVTTGRPMRPGFRHRAGSITKTFAATAILQVVGEGRIDLDAPVARYLPQYDTGDVTVRMLLNHTSGIADFDSLLWLSAEDLIRYQHTTFTPDFLVRLSLAQPRGPRTHSYSNTNYLLAGMVLEKATGRDAMAEVHRRVIAPLHLRHTYLAGSSERIRGPHSKAYIPWLDGNLRDFSVYNMSWGWMLGDLVSTTEDLNTFFRALLTGRLLRPAQLAQMKTTVPFDPAEPEIGGYGLGLYSILTPCGLVWGHDGLTFGHSMISLITPDGSHQVSIGGNMTHYSLGPTPIEEAIGRLLLQELCPTPSLRQAFTWRSPVHANKSW